MQVFSAVVGISFRPASAKEVMKSLEIGDEVTFEAEPTNPYDSNAVKVFFGDEWIGYLSRESNAEVAEHLSHDGTYRAEVVSFLSQMKPHLSIELQEDEDDDGA